MRSTQLYAIRICSIQLMIIDNLNVIMKNVYTIIRSDEQYMNYCQDLEKLTIKYDSKPTSELLDLIDTITLLINQYDEEHSKLKEVDPIQLLKSLMKENNLKQKDLVKLLNISKGHLSDILNYKKGLSKNVIRILSERFNVSQSAFNRPYKLSAEANKHYRNARMMNYKKDLETADHR